MVRVCLTGEEAVEYSVSDIRSMTRDEVLLAVTKREPTPRMKLLLCGRAVPAGPLSAVDMDDDDCLRIVDQDADASSSSGPSALDTVKLAECRRLLDAMQRSENGYAMAMLMESISAPGHVQRYTVEFPELAADPAATRLISDYFLIAAVIGEDDDKTNAFLSAHPSVVPAVHRLLTTQRPGGKRPPTGRQAGAGAPANDVPARAQPITSEMLQNALALALGGAGGSGGAPAAAPPPAPAPVVDTAALRERYSAQLSQLSEFGFSEEGVNVRVLESTGGNVELALELLLEMREAEMQ